MGRLPYPRRSFLSNLLGGLAFSTAATRSWAGTQVGAVSKKEGSSKDSSPQDASLLFNWNLQVVRRVPIVSGRPRYRAFTAIAKLQNGDLLVAYREGTDHWVTKDGIVRLVRSRDGGRTWSQPVTVWKESGHNLGTHIGLTQLSDGTLLLPVQDVLRLTPQPFSIKAYMMRSTDNGYLWSAPEEPKAKALSQFDWYNTYGKILELEDGTILWSIGYHEKGYKWWRMGTGLLVSHDGGHTWPEFRNIAYGTNDEKAVMMLPGGRMIAIIRDGLVPQYFLQTYSIDKGLTWSPLVRTNIQGHSPCLFRAPSGALLLAHRGFKVRKGSTGGPEYYDQCVGLASSLDDGETWHAGKDIYRPPRSGADVGYPSMIQLDDKQILCVYYNAGYEETTPLNSQIEGVFLKESI